MKFITEFDEEKKYQAIGLALGDIKEFMALSDIVKATKETPKGNFKTADEIETAYGNQGFKNILTVIQKLCIEHSKELIAVNKLFWQPEVVQKPVKVKTWNEDGFPVEEYKKDDDGHVVFEEYQETEKDIPSVFKTVAQIPMLITKEPWIIDFFTSLGGLKSMI